MRIILKLTKNKQIVPFDYQSSLVGRLHRWLGKNDLHDKMSLYSFSWLKEGKVQSGGLNFPNGASWTINSFDINILKTIIGNIQNDREVAFGMCVQNIAIQEDPYFGHEYTFKVASPIFIKQLVNNRVKFYFYYDEESSIFLTNTLQNKLKKAGLNHNGVSVEFVKNYHNPVVKKSTYKGIENKGSICPVTIKGAPEQILFAWNVGIGNSTGIGFGSLI